MDRLICRLFGCNGARLTWLSSNRVAIACTRCGQRREHRR